MQLELEATEPQAIVPDPLDYSRFSLVKPQIVIGCPVRKRGWILPRWFEHTEEALAEAGIQDRMYVFVVSKRDTESVRAICAAVQKHQCPTLTSWVDEEDTDDVRVWDLQRYEHMVRLRTQLLDWVRQLAPDLFWSLDSDILVHPDSLRYAIQAIRDNGWAACGTRCYMGLGTACPSYAMVSYGGALSRYDSEGTFEVDAIMASKVMTPPAYSVDYAHHAHGEDIGWSLAVRTAGHRLGWDGRTVSRHVMAPELLDEVDERVR